MTRESLRDCLKNVFAAGTFKGENMFKVFTGYCPKCGCELVLDDETYDYEAETRCDWYHCPVCAQIFQVDEQDYIYAVAK